MTWRLSSWGSDCDRAEEPHQQKRSAVGPNEERVGGSCRRLKRCPSVLFHWPSSWTAGVQGSPEAFPVDGPLPFSFLAPRCKHQSPGSWSSSPDALLPRPWWAQPCSWLPVPLEFLKSAFSAPVCCLRPRPTIPPTSGQFSSCLSFNMATGQLPQTRAPASIPTLCWAPPHPRGIQAQTWNVT